MSGRGSGAAEGDRRRAIRSSRPTPSRLQGGAAPRAGPRGSGGTSASAGCGRARCVRQAARGRGGQRLVPGAVEVRKSLRGKLFVAAVGLAHEPAGGRRLEPEALFELIRRRTHEGRRYSDNRRVPRRRLRRLSAPRQSTQRSPRATFPRISRRARRARCPPARPRSSSPTTDPTTRSTRSPSRGRRSPRGRRSWSRCGSRSSGSPTATRCRATWG